MEGDSCPRGIDYSEQWETDQEQVCSTRELSHWSDTKSFYKISLGLCEGGVWYLKLSVCACVLGEGRTGLK